LNGTGPEAGLIFIHSVFEILMCNVYLHFTRLLTGVKQEQEWINFK